MGIISRRDFLKSAGAAIASIGVPALVTASTEKQADISKPNILFIAVDDLRCQLGCYGNEQMITPNIDSLASGGVKFNRAYCQVPVCGASRASIMTGVRPTRERFVDHKTLAEKDAPNVTTVNTHFTNHGYYTVSVGKVFHHSPDNAGGWSEEPWIPPRPYNLRYLLPESQRIWDKHKKTSKKRRVLGPAFEAADVADNLYSDGQVADRAIEKLGMLSKKEEPFMLAVGFYKPHLPFNCPKKYWDLYDRNKIDLADNPFKPKEAPDAAMHNWSELRAYAQIPQDGPLTDEMARNLVHGYYACVSYTDAQIGKVLSELERLGLRDNTVVVLWGDHGWNLREHGLWCKHCNFETSLHSPLIVSVPGMNCGKETDALVEYLDMYPSLCQLANLPVPNHLHGRSFVPLLKNPNIKWKEAVFSRWIDGDSVKTEGYRYTEWRNKEGKIYARMLYDHKADPGENINIAEKAENAGIVKKLSNMLLNIRLKSEDIEK
jgi:arylsulfatase A-like enzyme